MTAFIIGLSITLAITGLHSAHSSIGCTVKVSKKRLSVLLTNESC